MSIAGAKILEGLRDAVAGNFAAVTIEGQRWIRAPKWQTIDSAPKDGTSVLASMISGTDGPYYVIYWNGQHFENVETGEEVPVRFATHWQTLPPPPEGE